MFARCEEMGVCLSIDQEERKARARSDEIDRRLQTSGHEEDHVIKILLLGAGESGKSTLVKQMKIIHNDGFTRQELQSFTAIVLENLLSSMKFVLNGMGLLRINLELPRNRIHAQTLLACLRCYDEDHVMFTFIGNALKSLWIDAGVRRAVARGYEYELNDSAIYYFENMERICSEKYQPSETDVLRARVRTMGIIETCFKIRRFIFRMFDVGGQRSQRHKWIQCFDDARAVLFVTSLSGYDMTLLEDSAINRLQESLKLFRQIVNNSFFTSASMILFLNKLDLFQDKILHSERHLKYYFHQYQGPAYNTDSAAHFIQTMFLHQIHNQTKVVYPHFTTATDTSNIQVVFQVVMDTIIKDNIAAVQLL